MTVFRQVFFCTVIFQSLSEKEKKKKKSAVPRKAKSIPGRGSSDYKRPKVRQVIGVLGTTRKVSQ